MSPHYFSSPRNIKPIESRNFANFSRFFKYVTIAATAIIYLLRAWILDRVQDDGNEFVSQEFRTDATTPQIPINRTQINFCHNIIECILSYDSIC